MTDYIANFELNQNNIDADFSLENTEFDALFEINPAGANWGSITGHIEDQTDLYNILNAKADITALNQVSSNLTALTVTVGDNYTVLDGKISALSTTVNNNYSILDNRLDTAEGSILNLADTVSGNYTELNNKIITNTDNITSINNTIDNYGDIVTYNVADFATKNQGLLADSALQPNDNITLLNNNAGYITNAVNDLTNYYLKSETYTKLEVQQLIASIPQFSVEVVQILPITGERMVLYLVPKDGEAPDIYNEYIWIEDEEEFELIGSTAVDLTDYVTNSDLATTLNDYALISQIPTNNNQLINGAGYITANDLPTVGNGTLTIQTNGSTVATFTANQSGNTTANIVVPDSATWGNITGDISDQTDLQAILDTKQDLLTPDNAGTDIAITAGGSGGSKTVSGTGSVILDNATEDSLNSVTVMGACEQNGTPTPTTPVNIVCNNGALKVKNKAGLPDEYESLRYITASGTQYITTNYYPTEKTVVNTKMYITANSVTIFGTRWSGQPEYDTFGVLTGASGNLVCYFGRYSDGEAITIPSTAVTTNTEHSIYFGLNNFAVDGTSYSITRSTFTATTPLILGALWNNGTITNQLKGRLYEVVITEDGEVVADYVPCRRKADSVLGVYDIVSGTFYTNAGTGTFTAGNVDFELYVDGVIETIEDELNNTATAEMLLNVGDYTDAQELISGAITRNVAIKVLNGSETWTALNNSRGYYTNIPDIVGLPYDVGAYCTHFSFYAWTTQGEQMPDNSVGFNKNSNSNVCNGNVTFKPNLTTYNNVTAWKDFLTAQYTAKTPVILVYPLATATTETVTGQTLTTQEGENTLTITQASIANLPISANYGAQGSTLISFTNESGYITANDLPTVGNGTITFTQGGVTKGTITTNQSSDTTIAFDAGGSSGAVDSVNGQTGTVVLTASDVGALADTVTIPTKTSDLTNDSGFITGITSSDVTTALGYTPYNSSNPNGYTSNVGTVTSVNNVSPDNNGNVTINIPDISTKQDTLVSGTNIKTINNTSLLGSGNIETTKVTLRDWSVT